MPDSLFVSHCKAVYEVGISCDVSHWFYLCPGALLTRGPRFGEGIELFAKASFKVLECRFSPDLTGVGVFRQFIPPKRHDIRGDDLHCLRVLLSNRTRQPEN